MMWKKIIMKTLMITILACGIALAQTKPAAPAATKKAAPAAAAPDLLKPGTLKGKAPETYKVKFTTTKGRSEEHTSELQSHART
jgi:hypothetical protein